MLQVARQNKNKHSFIANHLNLSDNQSDILDNDLEIIWQLPLASWAWMERGFTSPPPCSLLGTSSSTRTCAARFESFHIPKIISGPICICHENSSTRTCAARSGLFPVLFYSVTNFAMHFKKRRDESSYCCLKEGIFIYPDVWLR